MTKRPEYKSVFQTKEYYSPTVEEVIEYLRQFVDQKARVNVYNANSDDGSWDLEVTYARLYTDEDAAEDAKQELWRKRLRKAQYELMKEEFEGESN